MRNAEPVIHTEEFNLASFPPSYPEIWLTHFRALGGECWNLPPITAGIRGTALQLGLCHLLAEPQQGRAAPPAAGTVIAPLCGTSHPEDVPDNGIGHCADTGTRKGGV